MIDLSNLWIDELTIYNMLEIQLLFLRHEAIVNLLINSFNPYSMTTRKIQMLRSPNLMNYMTMKRIM